MVAAGSVKAEAVRQERVGSGDENPATAAKAGNSRKQASSAPLVSSVAEKTVAHPGRLDEQTWAAFDRLSVDEKFDKLCVSDPGKLQFLECVCTAWKKRHKQFQDGLFLALRSPGRNDTHYTAYVRTWAELRAKCNDFAAPRSDLARAQARLLDSICLYDSKDSGPRSVVGFKLTCIENAREILEAAHVDELGSGRLGSTEIRTGDDDDYHSITEKSQSRAYEKKPSRLYSGSVASLLAVTLLRNLDGNLASRAARPPKPLGELSVATFEYLQADFAELVRAFDTSVIVCPQVDQDVVSKVLQEEVLKNSDAGYSMWKLFSCPFLQWKTPQDVALQFCAQTMLDMHAKKIADALITETSVEAPVGRRIRGRTDTNTSSSECSHELRRSSQAEETCTASFGLSPRGTNPDGDDGDDDGSSTSTEEGEEEEAGSTSNKRDKNCKTAEVKHSTSSTSLSSLYAFGSADRSRGESAETMSLSSINSSSTGYEDGHTPPSWPSSHLVNTLRQERAGKGSSTREAENDLSDKTLVITDIQPSILQQLDQDLDEMATMLERIAETRRPWQLAVAERIKSLVAALFPGATASVFGSLATGMAAPCSDVDMVVQNINVSQRMAMRLLVAHLKEQSWVQMIQAVEHSAVPVIRLSTAQIPISFGNQGSLINVDITFDNYAHHGLRTCNLVRGLVSRYPPLKPLALVLKQFLVEKGLNDPFVGGLSSYGLVLMIVSVLQRYFPAGMMQEKGQLGPFFVAFLRCFATPAFIDRGVWVYTAELRSEGELAQAEMAYRRVLDVAKTKGAADPLYILDPMDLQTPHNIGRTCFGIHQVIQAFAEALDAVQLSAVKTDGVSSQDWSILGSIFSAGHHRHVVNLVTQVWCPRENPVAKKVNVEDWALTAKIVLQTIASKQNVPCPLCDRRPHAPTCTLQSLLASFPPSATGSSSPRSSLLSFKK
ncbi:Poly(A) RNA polymerase cid14 (PAP) (Caffeine-induced death protein 14) (Polynucleotide adenylyltransferase cid14) [Durusdinium trenchii]|uniref:Poly(A) RNA polymerase cid14 (PAP) (Caffeine-induced death protein 14) (Polynucleotide adenylyltransferase cid14) n=1 Tax=Durusdinium trenchii TaxID=1381693 RepID=A0ABP0RES5_9DINO